MVHAYPDHSLEILSKSFWTILELSAFFWFFGAVVSHFVAVRTAITGTTECLFIAIFPKWVVGFWFKTQIVFSDTIRALTAKISKKLNRFCYEDEPQRCKWWLQRWKWCLIGSDTKTFQWTFRSRNDIKAALNWYESNWIENLSARWVGIALN